MPTAMPIASRIIVIKKMISFKQQINKKKQSGFTILVAVVTAGILLIIAMTIGGIALKEQVLSTASKESQIAYYAADSGMECALFWDQKKGVFSPGTDQSNGDLTLPDVPTINCNGKSIVTKIIDDKNSLNYVFQFLIPGLPGVGSEKSACAVVEITKTTADKYSITKTMVESHGYNTCDASLRRLERGIVATYPKI